MGRRLLRGVALRRRDAQRGVMHSSGCTKMQQERHPPTPIALKFFNFSLDLSSTPRLERLARRSSQLVLRREWGDGLCVDADGAHR